MMYVPGMFRREEKGCKCICHDDNDGIKSTERHIFELIKTGSKKEVSYASDVKIDKIILRELFYLAEGTAFIIVDDLGLNDQEFYCQPMIIKAAYDFLRKDDSILKIIVKFKDKYKESLSDNEFLASLNKFKEKIFLYEAINEARCDNHNYVVVSSYDWYALMMKGGDVGQAMFNDGTIKGKTKKKGEKLFIYCDFVANDKTRSLPIDKNLIWKD